ncbi:acetyltransferase [Halioglobus japonicus]|uniref:N-acetyltransferase n=2 Tax=Halioglobus japonicus TaxID=930805 RepID=A0AAP8MBY4_9GAMM|nr:N-acetyltransferase [Halioglobus japonicus]GHD21417.1 acetyltransferase [Halioglobus japonicus]
MEINKQEIYMRDGDLELRSLEGDDLAYTLSWRNSPDVRKWFLNDAVITEKAHKDWYHRNLSNDKDIVLIGHGGTTKERVCQVSIYNIDESSATAEVGRFVSNPRTVGMGFVRRSIILLIEFAFSELEMQELYLEVKDDNFRAIELYKSLGFKVTLESEKMLRMGLCRAQ